MEEITSPPSKRRKTKPAEGRDDLCDAANEPRSSLGTTSLERPISPPPLKRSSNIAGDGPQPVYIDSPFLLTTIRDLPQAHNVNTVQLSDLLRDPLIKEVWQFNFLFDIDFLMSAFDDDVRHLVQVKVVHGFWKRDDPGKRSLERMASQYSNVQLISAYMPEMFGTHHSKMMILFLHDDTAQVIIHTANMIPRDWANLCQAVWHSPILPLVQTSNQSFASETPSHPIGSGPRFKHDLLRYLSAYGKSRLGVLTDKLVAYDFGKVRAALIASTPAKVPRQASRSSIETSWGWVGLKEILSTIPVTASFDKPTIVSQVSSIATLGQTSKWLDEFFDILASSSTPRNLNSEKPRFKIIFPTADEIRRSLDGYASGASIHTRIQSQAQQKQLQYLRPNLCHWAESKIESTDEPIREAGRGRAAPHIKTYIRFASKKMDKIDWAMVTSANLSTQAWGASINNDGQVRICSYEIGVVIWPALFDEPETTTETISTLMGGAGGNEGPQHAAKVIMVPTFKTNSPQSIQSADENVSTVAGLRLPYDLPLVPYEAKELPWCATADYSEPDWKGATWQHQT